MISTLNVAAVALGALAFWTCIGAAITRRLMPASLALPLAPTVGWAVHSVLALPLFSAIGFSQIGVVTVAALALIASWVSRRAPAVRPASAEGDVRVPAWAYAAAALLAIAPTVALLPKHLGDGIILAGPIYDHSKAAIVDEMARLGVPPGNPFVGGSAGAGRLVYYYLLHFSAAQLSLAFRISGWAALAVMTWVAAFASLAAMMGLAVRFGGRRSAALWVIPLALAGSLRPLIHLVWDPHTLDPVLRIATGFGGWLFQSAWVPQHLMSASCAVVAVLLMARLAERGILRVIVLALMVAAGFEASAWVCGITFAAAAPVIGAVLLVRAAPDQRVRLVLRFAAAGLLTVVVAAPFLRDQIAAMASRDGSGAIAFRPYDVLGEFFPERVRWLLDVPAYWLMLLIELPAIAVTGTVALIVLLRRRAPDAAIRGDALALALLGAAGIIISWLFASTLGDNNDLGWRSVLPAILALTAFAAAGLSGWIAARWRVAAAAALVAIVLGLPRSYEIIRANAAGVPAPDARAFARAPTMWAAVRRHSAPDERVADNPALFADITPWPANISWALMANRRSCYAGREFGLIFAGLPQARREAIDALFIRVFAGEGSADDLRDLATVYGCRVVVVTSADGAWTHDPFAPGPYYRLVEAAPDRWRIYRIVER